MADHEVPVDQLARLDQKASGWDAQLDQLVDEVRGQLDQAPGGAGGMIAAVAMYIRSRINGPDPSATVAVLAAAAVLRLARIDDDQRKSSGDVDH